VRTWAVLGGIAVALAGGGIAMLATSDEGIRGAITRALDDNDRTSAWWAEAFGAWADKPVRGWGADAFGVSRRLYRATPANTGDAHSLPLGILADTGVIGALLALGGLLALAVAAGLAVRRLPTGRERDIAGALLAAVAAWGVHALVSADWAVPGVTVPVLLFLGVLVARRAAAAPAPAPSRPAVIAPSDDPALGRFLALGVACLLLSAAMVSAVLPAWSDARTDAALAEARDRSPQSLEDAATKAELAARLDPVAIRPLLAAATIALERGRALEVRAHLLEAVERQPWSVVAWTRLSRTALGLADRDGALRAAHRAVALDPGDPGLVRFARYVEAMSAPPEASATAVGTPLPAVP
jgi:hypothetical protein